MGGTSYDGWGWWRFMRKAPWSYEAIIIEMPDYCWINLIFNYGVLVRETTTTSDFGEFGQKQVLF